jgi:hypothetical protein
LEQTKIDIGLYIHEDDPSVYEAYTYPLLVSSPEETPGLSGERAAESGELSEELFLGESLGSSLHGVTFQREAGRSYRQRLRAACEMRSILSRRTVVDREEVDDHIILPIQDDAREKADRNRSIWLEPSGTDLRRRVRSLVEDFQPVSRLGRFEVRH